MSDIFVDSSPSRSDYTDCADWLMHGAYRNYVDGVRTIGDLTLVRGSQPPGHFPDPPFSEYSLIATTAGHCAATIDFGDGPKRYRASRGSMIVAPTQTACDYVKDAPCETLVLGIPAKLVEKFAEAGGVKATNLGFCHRYFRDPLIETLCERLWLEAVAQNPFGRLFVDHALNAMVASLVATGHRAPQTANLPKPLPAAHLQRIHDYIQANLARSITLAELAGLVHLSEFHFARAFKRSTGTSPAQYVIRERVERAKRLIRAGGTSLARVALAVGFSNQSHLNRHFKRLTGGTPSRFRA